MTLVVIESPFAGDVAANVEYARRCLRDSLGRGEHPIASHLLYTQPGVLDDAVPEERRRGIEAGFAWGARADLVAFYLDRGWSPGMRTALSHWSAAGVPQIVERFLGAPVERVVQPTERSSGFGSGLRKAELVREEGESSTQAGRVGPQECPANRIPVPLDSQVEGVGRGDVPSPSIRESAPSAGAAFSPADSSLDLRPTGGREQVPSSGGTGPLGPCPKGCSKGASSRVPAATIGDRAASVTPSRPSIHGPAGFRPAREEGSPGDSGSREAEDGP